MKRICISLSDKQLEYLQELRKKDYISISQLMRLAIGEYIRNHTDGIGLKSDTSQKQPIPTINSAEALRPCEWTGCKRTTMKVYPIKFIDDEGNEKTTEVWYCNIHAEKSTEVEK